MEANPSGPTRSIGDFEDFTKMALASDELEALVGDRGECVLSWTNREGDPVGVVMAYVYRDGCFWTNCTSHRQRVTALRARPQAAVVLNRAGKMASFKGEATIHSPIHQSWQELKTWFYSAMSGSNTDPQNILLRKLEAFLEGPRQVIIEIRPRLVLSFDFNRFSAITQAAITGRR